MGGSGSARAKETRASWGARYVGVALLLLGLSVVAVWYYAGYRQQSFNELLSFRVDDGWCAKGVQSVGAHCWGDYAGVDAGLRAGNLWDPKQVTATAYPPLSLVPPIAFVQLGRLTNSWTFGRDLFLLLLAASLLTPALWVARLSWWERGPTAVLIIGVATAPFLILMDRGNTAALLVAPLLGMALAYMRSEPRRMIPYIVVLTLLKPQMLLLALLFIVFREYGYIVFTAAVSIVLTFAGFLFFPGSISDNVSNWLHMTRGYQTYQVLQFPYPYNLGAGRSIVTLFDISHLGSLTGPTTHTHLASSLQSHAGLLGLLLTAVTVWMLFARKRESNPLYPLITVCALIAIAPGTSYSYYLVLMLIPVAFILHDPVRARGERQIGAPWSGVLDREDDDSSWGHTSRWLLVACLALLLSPLIIPTSSISFVATQVISPLDPVGLLQLLWGPILLVLFFLTVAMALHQTHRQPVGANASGAATRDAVAVEPPEDD